MKQKTELRTFLPLDLDKNIAIIGPDTNFSTKIIDKLVEEDLLLDFDQDVIFLNYPNESLKAHNVLYLSHGDCGPAINYLYEVLLQCQKDKTSLKHSLRLVINDLEKLIIQIKYAYKVDEVSSVAYKLKKILTQGTKVGIKTIVNSHRYTSDSFPSGAKTDFSQIVVLKINNPNELAVMNVSKSPTDTEVSINNTIYDLADKNLSLGQTHRNVERGTTLQKKIDNFVSSLDLEDLTTVRKLPSAARPYSSIIDIVKKVLINFGATDVKNSKFQMSESLMNFSYLDKSYSVFIYNKDTTGDTKNLIAFSQLEQTSEVLVISLSDESFFKASTLKSYPVLFVKDLEQLVKYKIDEQLLEKLNPKMLREIQITLPFFKVGQK